MTPPRKGDNTRNLRNDAELRGIRPRLELLASPERHWPRSDHFNGSQFFNTARSARGMGDVLTWLRSRQPSPWPAWEENLVFAPPPACFSENPADWQAVFINHATVLLQLGPLNVITDPVYSERCSPFTFLGPKRVRRPGVALVDLPPIHVVLLSHNHYDHLDVRTLKWLAARDNPLVVTGLGNRRYLQRNGIQHVVELDWWQSTTLGDTHVHFVPAQHFSGRGLRDRDRTLWGGLVVETLAGKAFFAGDTGYGPHFKEIRARLGVMRLSLLPIGAYEPRWFMEPVHMNPHDAVLAHLDLETRQSLAMHFNTFQLTDEPIDQPVKDLRQAQARLGVVEPAFAVIREGEALAVAP